MYPGFRVLPGIWLGVSATASRDYTESAIVTRNGSVGLSAGGRTEEFPRLAVSGALVLLFASLAILCGYQWILFAIFAQTFAITEGFLPPDRQLERFFKVVNLEKGLVVAELEVLVAGGLLLAAIRQWWLADFGHLDYAYTMRFVVPGATLIALGFQTAFSSFFVSILGMRRR